MANRARRRRSNVPGDFFVDSSCIDCGACRWMAPAVFDASGDQSRVHTQPSSPDAIDAALAALVACPTASIGTSGDHDLGPIVASFPRVIEGDVHHCGFHHEDSFGAASYLVTRPAGNILIDSPRFTQPLVRRLEQLGGVSLMFLTHCDDVADHQRFRDHFGCERMIHRDDVRASTRNAEHVVDGVDPRALDDDAVVVPVPGHTAGSMCLLYRGRFLFSGDHLAYSLSMCRLYAFSDACWYDWDTQIESMDRLTEFAFSWVLPGHDAPCHLPAEDMRAQLRDCVARMRAQ